MYIYSVCVCVYVLCVCVCGWVGAVCVECRKEGPLPLEEVIRDYVKLAVDCDNNTSNTKYCVAQMLQSAMEGPSGKALLGAANMREIW